ncbi:hypothetical protein CYMTET_27255 [Cymbomonas tetramitiformis]|uniref:Uncharacterized protein n=1 Tax=Cymbomonas tetramitiformis TaxID=36881 RepID=A0AAE0FRP6_9CHLO|nr:hypothetical protein CYMTET_27255 [Cymbomonas tetramitiformis]
MLQLRPSIDAEGTSKSDTYSMHVKVKFVEDCVYQGTEDPVTDKLLKEYLVEFDKSKNKTAMFRNVKQLAWADNNDGGRGARWKDDKDDKERRPAEGKGQRWSDSPKIFVKFMRALVECLCSPRAVEDRRKVLRLRDGRVATPRWQVRRRAGGVRRDLRRRVAKVLPYMNDFLVLPATWEEAFIQGDGVQRVLARLWPNRNEAKGRWELGQLIEHLGLEVDLKDGLFRETEKRVLKIHAQTKASICKATRGKRWTGVHGGDKFADTAAEMQAVALQRTMADNYGRHWDKLVKFCGEEGLRWLPSTQATVLLYVASLLNSSTMKGTSLQLYLSAIKSLHEEFNFSGQHRHRSLGGGAKEKGKNHLLCKRRIWIPVDGVADLHELLDRLEQARDEAWLQDLR